MKTILERINDMTEVMETLYLTPFELAGMFSNTLEIFEDYVDEHGNCKTEHDLKMAEAMYIKLSAVINVGIDLEGAEFMLERMNIFCPSLKKKEQILTAVKSTDEV